MKEKTKVLAVVGPTASGKTALGIALAKSLNGEIVSCDSMQIYKGLPIGTAQPTAEELSQATHHLVSFLDVKEAFSVSDYVNLASKVINEISQRGKLPVLVGGTGLYARSLLRGFSFEENCRDDELRQRLLDEAEQKGAQVLYERLKALDPRGAEEIHPNNIKRVIRALEYCILADEPFSAQAERSKTAQSPYDFIMLCPTFKDRQKLYDRIDMRVDKMLDAGLLQEAEDFYKLCTELGTPPTAAQAIGYKELFPFFKGEIPLSEAVENLKRESRRYAKRQLTWFSREQEIHYLYLDELGSMERILQEALHILERENFVS